MKTGKDEMNSGGKKSFVHGIINVALPFLYILIIRVALPFFLPESTNPWALFVPILILTFLPFVSDAAAIIIACTRAAKTNGENNGFKDKWLMWGLCLSIFAAFLHAFLRFGLKL